MVGGRSTERRSAQDIPRPHRPRRPLLVPLAAALAALGLLLALPAPRRRRPTRAVADLTVSGGAEVRLGATGPTPRTVSIEPGQTVRWRNEADTLRLVSADGGQFDSGPVPVGGGFAVAFPGHGTYRYTVDPGGATGIVHVGDRSLPGPPDAPVADQLVEIPYPRLDPADVSVHPDLAWTASRTRALVGFAAGTTVQQADDVLTRADVVVLGVLADEGELLVAAPDSPDFSALDEALAQLRSEPTVAYAAMDVLDSPDRLPPGPTDPELLTGEKYGWDVPSTTGGLGEHGNWNLETTRVPQAWNLDRAEATGPSSPRIVVFDGSFDTNSPDLRGVLTVHELCFDAARTDCDRNRPYEAEHDANGAQTGESGDHGTADAVIAGGTFDDRVPGVDPVAAIVGVPKSSYREPVSGVAQLVRDIESGSLGDVRVVNHSYGSAVDALTWVAAHPTFTCGPGPADDATGTGPCTPWTYDRSLQERAQTAEAVRPWLRRLAADGVLWVNSAGNDSGALCDAGGSLQIGDVSTDSLCPPLVAPASGNNGITMAGATWDPADGPNPVLSVGGLGALGADHVASPDLGRIRFSNDGSTVSAPGWMVTSKVGGTYAVFAGTSQAAPQVAGLAASLAAMPSRPSLSAVRAAITGWARPDTTGGVGPRVDDFASLLSLPGAAHALVDVSDVSLDGNRRVLPNPGGSTVLDTTVDPDHPAAGTAPDGTVDMRDFRRFRDAWLEVCQLGGTDQACPDPGAIRLDGPPDHPKRDLNLDRCTDFLVTGTSHYCAATEGTYPRLDFNGDGRVSSGDTAVVPLTASGAPAGDPSAATAMTDLQVLASQYDDPPSGQWTAADLPGLMTSGDLTVDVGGLFSTGASRVSVTAADATTHDPLVTVDADAGSGEAVLTVPSGAAVELSALVRRPRGTEVVGGPGPLTLAPGEDRAVTVCGLRLLADPTTLRPDGVSTSTLTATIDACASPTVGGVPVEVTVSPAGSGGLVVSDPSPVTDGSGRAVTTLTAGVDRATYTVTASAQVDDGHGGTTTLTGQVLLRVDQQYALDVIVETGGGGAFTSLGHGPGIDASGDVAFTGLPSATGSTTGVFRSDDAAPRGPHRRHPPRRRGGAPRPAPAHR